MGYFPSEISERREAGDTRPLTKSEVVKFAKAWLVVEGLYNSELIFDDNGGCYDLTEDEKTEVRRQLLKQGRRIRKFLGV
jgi:hypothetical protein